MHTLGQKFTENGLYFPPVIFKNPEREETPTSGSQLSAAIEWYEAALRFGAKIFFLKK